MTDSTLGANLVNRAIIPVSLVLGFVLMAGCEETIRPVNKPPVITSITADPDTVAIGDTTTITVVAEDLESDSMTFSWSSEYGTLSGNGESVVWTAPYASGLRDILLTVTDPFAGQADTSVAIAVTAPRLISVATTGVPNWLDAPPLIVTAGSVPRFQNDYGTVPVSLKSAHTATDIYILASWSDPSGTQNVNKKAWSYDSQANAWSQSTTEDEDRLIFMFDVGDNGTEGADCATMCHLATGEMKTTGGGHVDVWHWKAARTDPVGLADDEWWDGTGRVSDANAIRAYSDNITASGNFPKYAGGTSAYGDFIKIEVGETVADLTLFDSTDANLRANTYPGYILDLNAGPSGESRHDVLASGRYSGGVWTVEFQRALDTGHIDDVTFTVGGVHPFSLAVTDNDGGQHSGAGVIDLIIQK